MTLLKWQNQRLNFAKNVAPKLSLSLSDKILNQVRLATRKALLVIGLSHLYIDLDLDQVRNECYLKLRYKYLCL